MSFFEDDSVPRGTLSASELRGYAWIQVNKAVTLAAIQEQRGGWGRPSRACTRTGGYELQLRPGTLVLDGGPRVSLASAEGGAWLT